MQQTLGQTCQLHIVARLGSKVFQRLLRVVAPPVEAPVSLSGNSSLSFFISKQTLSKGWPETLSLFP
jgi:hypothetical protein